MIETIWMVKGSDQPARGRIPELDGFVSACRQDPGAVRTELRLKASWAKTLTSTPGRTLCQGRSNRSSSSLLSRPFGVPTRAKKTNPQKLASQVGRKLQQLKAHKYFHYQVDEQGQLQYQKNDELIRNEQSLDGLYLLTPIWKRLNALKSRCWAITRTCWRSKMPSAN